MQPNAVAIVLPDASPAAAPPLGTSSPPAPPPSERLAPLIGECMAAAAIQVLFDMSEYAAGRRAPWKGQGTEGGDRIAELYELRQVSLMTGELYASFEQVARVHGTAALCKRANGKLSTRMVNILIDGVLEVLGKVVQSKMQYSIGTSHCPCPARFEAAPNNGKARRFKEFVDGAASWSRVERIIARVEASTDGTDTRFIVTNLDTRNARVSRSNRL